MPRKSRAQTWYERQGYQPQHAVHSGTSYVEQSPRTDPDEAEDRHEHGVEARGGDVPITFNTRSSNPARPRTRAGGYDSQTRTLSVVFRDGAVYEYYDVSRIEAARIKRSASAGKFINRVLSDKAYGRVS